MIRTADAKSRGHSSIVALLEEHLDSKYPLHTAARSGDVAAMTQLDGGADGEETDAPMKENGRVDAALLLDKGAEADRANKKV